MANSENNKELASNVDTRPGASMHLTYTERTMKMYCVSETDLEHLTLLDTWSKYLFSAGSFFLAIVATIGIGWAMQLQFAELNKIATLLIVVFGILSALCYGFGAWMSRNHKLHWKKIGSQSKELAK